MDARRGHRIHHRLKYRLTSAGYKAMSSLYELQRSLGHER